jgi:DNA ligase-1
MKVVNSIEELMEAHINWTSEGFEGTMIRRADGKDCYKASRSTNKEVYLCKIKDFADDEAVILDFVERQHNGNEATKDNLGHTKRSSHLENMLGRGDLGAIVVKSDKFSEPFNIGSGFDDALRAEMWNNRDEYLGKLVTFTHQPSGAKAEGKPRFPVFKAFREEWDLS